MNAGWDAQWLELRGAGAWALMAGGGCSAMKKEVSSASVSTVFNE